MPEQFFVAAKAWIVRYGRTLVLQDTNGAWDLPGGRIGGAEFGLVTFHEVLKRELLEEIGFDLTRSELLGVSQWTREPRPGETPPIRIFVVHYGVEAPPGFTATLSEEHVAAQWTEEPRALLPPGLIPERPFGD